MIIDATGLHYKELNEKIRRAIREGAKELKVIGVNGHRFIADGLKGNAFIVIEGVPGNDLGAFMKGPTVIVRGNGQDHVGNTLDEGKIVIHGSAGDVLGYGMRGGKLFIKGDAGYRVGIHMKQYKGKVPVIVIGGKVGDFFGEYMAGGILIVLGLNTGYSKNGKIAGNFLATGMHGGTIFLRGKVEKYQLGKEVAVFEPEGKDWKLIENLVHEFSKDLGLEAQKILEGRFVKIVPVSHRPYGNLYAY